MTVEISDPRQVRAVRAALGLNLREMGLAAGLHRSTVFVVERASDITRHRHAVTAIALAALQAGILCETVDGEPVIRFQAAGV